MKVVGVQRLCTRLHRQLRGTRRIIFFTCATGIFPTGRRSARQRWDSWPEPWSAAAGGSDQAKHAPGLLAVIAKISARQGYSDNSVGK